MSTQLTPMREIPHPPKYGPNDYLVLFGQLFGKGYANGIIHEAQKLGMKIVGSTVGVRGPDGSLNPLNTEELAVAQSQAAFHHFINIPLEAGFDLEKSNEGRSPVDQLQGVKMDGWENIFLSWSEIEESRHKGIERFRASTKKFVVELLKVIPESSNVVFVHTMAGGIPRAKILMPTMNKIFKGRGDRFLSSERFWNSSLGKLCTLSFDEVTAQTFHHLVDLTGDLRNRNEMHGARVSYLAYGYHGTEILIKDEFRWQSYSPYLQGFAKMKLEEISQGYFKKGIKTCVFNCPEILTNSSNLFQGVEIPLYPFLGAYNKIAPAHPRTLKTNELCRSLLKPEYQLKDVMDITSRFFESDLIKKQFTFFNKWPQHNGPEQMELMLTTSDQIIDMHKDEKQTMTLELSRDIFEGTGQLMLGESFGIRQPVWWLGHDVLARRLLI